MAWNTLYNQEILKQLQMKGYDVYEKNLVHISPAPFEHINLLGKYAFKDEITGKWTTSFKATTQ